MMPITLLTHVGRSRTLRALFALCAALVLGMSTELRAAEINVSDYTATVIVGSSGLRVRDAPISGAQIGSLWNGQQVRVTHHVTPGVWRKIVMSNGRSGYVSGDYLSPPPPSGASHVLSPTSATSSPLLRRSPLRAASNLHCRRRPPCRRFWSR